MKMLNLRNNIGINIPFGIEIEFSRLNLNTLRNIINNLYSNDKLSKTLYHNPKYENWKVEADKSVTDSIGSEDYGGELISPILIDNYKYWKDIDMLCNVLIQNEAKIYDTSAAHIHVSSDILENNPDYFYKLFKLWVAFEDIIFKFSYNGDKARDSIFLYAAPMFKMFFEYRDSLAKALTMDDLKKLDFSDRNYALNFSNLFNNDKDTIEIRCPNGTLDAFVWQNNINFFVKLIMYVKNNNYDKELIDYYILNNHYTSLLIEAFSVYNMTNIEKAKRLSNLIFTNNLDKEYFIEQYTNDKKLIL